MGFCSVLPLLRTLVYVIGTVLRCRWVWSIDGMVLTGECEVLGEKRFQCQLIHHKSDTVWAWTEIRISFELYLRVYFVPNSMKVQPLNSAVLLWESQQNTAFRCVGNLSVDAGGLVYQPLCLKGMYEPVRNIPAAEMHMWPCRERVLHIYLASLRRVSWLFCVVSKSETFDEACWALTVLVLFCSVH